MTSDKSNPAASLARVLIVDDHPAVREALAIRVGAQPDMQVCGEAEDLADALRIAAEADPDVAIIDVALKTGSGIDLIKRLKARNDKIRTIVWSMFGEELYAERALRAGAMGYLTKDQGTGKIIDAIREVLKGNIYLSAGMTMKLVKRAVGQGIEGQSDSPLDILSNRELEVFRLTGKGMKTQEIAGYLHLSVNTVETYRDRIREKLDLADGAELARCALQWVLENG